VNDEARRVAGWRFWIVTVAALVAMVATASLGRWQLARAAQKQALQHAMDERMALPPLEARAFLDQAQKVSPDDATVDALLHRQVLLQGEWLADRSLYLDNRQMQGRQGFYVMTPLRLGNGPSAPVVLVQRGWVPRNFADRTQLPDVVTPTGPVQVLGRVAARPARLYELGSSGNGTGASRIRQNLDLAAYRLETGLPVMPLSIVQTTGDAHDGLLRDWPAVDAGVDKHYGYAFQWFGLCALVAILYVWFQLFRRFIRPRRQPST